MTNFSRSLVLLFSFVALVLAPVRAVAAPTAPSPVDAEAATAPIEPAPEIDLEQARADARARTAEDPSAENHRREAELAEAAGDHAAAAEAYQAEMDALPDGDPLRARARDDVARMRDVMRGRVADEPKSTHRKELDARWAVPPPKRSSVAKAVPDAAPPPKDDRIVKKWYFWVTIAAIAASAAAVAGIAIKASRADKPDALDRVGPRPMGLGAPGIRF
jgi:hypothetical protein